jgi:hypothetical protein
MTKEDSEHKEQASKQIKANRKDAVEHAIRQLSIPAKKKSREDVSQAAFRVGREAKKV